MFWYAHGRRDTEFTPFYSFTVEGSTNKKCYKGNKSEKHQLLMKKPKLKTIRVITQY